jgi:D-psicose/D-tagatose/L-ribulose 3-epimerase
MRLAISNIAWPAGADSEAGSIVHAQGVEGVELALTKIWPEPIAATEHEVRAYRERWEKQGFRIAALQALLFGKPHLTLFGPDTVRQQTLEYLGAIIERAAWLGARVLVFGSPKNRQRGGRSVAETWAIAVPFFRELGRIAGRHGVHFCIEPNPRDYGCDFVTTVAEGIELVDAVAEEGFGLHLDTGGMTLAGEPPTASIAAAAQRCRHFHVSEPFLAEVGGGTRVHHDECAEALRNRHYPGWVSIEMGEPKAEGSWRAAMERALQFVRKTYAAGGSHAAA